jgi:hypothetical protein
MSVAAARREHRRLSCNRVGDRVPQVCHNDDAVVRPAGALGRLHELTTGLAGLR